ncbi:MAG: hypothetical protein IKJ03_00920 [Mycoplasmataceae bacterium]|nr:hypothetical protein [Mycoplasmataceae bacterium]
MYLDWIRDKIPFEWFNIEKDKEHKEKEDKWYNPLDEAIEELKKKENIKIVEIDNDEPLDDEDCYGAD